MGSLSEGDAKNGGLNRFTYVSPPEGECPPPGKLFSLKLRFHMEVSLATIIIVMTLFNILQFLSLFVLS